MRPYAVTIPAGSVEEFAVVGDYIRLKTASVPVQFVVEETGESIELEQGDAANLSKFRRVKVLHADAAQQAIVFYVGNGTSAYSSKIGGSIAVSSLPSNAITMTQSTIDITAASSIVVPVKANRKFLMMQNISDTITIWFNLRGGDATLGSGFKLGPGDSLTLDQWVPNSYISAIGSAAAVQALAVLEG